MKTITEYLNKALFRGALSLIAVMLAAPAFAQDEVLEEEEAAEGVKARRVMVEKEKYDLVSIKGIVYDEATRKPLSGIQVKTLGNIRYSAMSDEDGTFTIRVPRFATSLFVHSPEYSSQQVALPSDTTHRVVIYMLSDKFAPMYADRTRYTAVGEFTAKADHAVTIDQELQAQLGADIRSIGRSATPAIGNNMFIRGINSINGSQQPLIIVDGVEMDMQFEREMLHNGNVNNMLANIMPSDIDKVTVLKNATALYGARGANGVILIDTKRGHSMATRIDANVSAGISLKPQLPTMMNAAQYRLYATEMIGTIDGMRTNMPSLNFLNDDPNGYYYHWYHNDTDWSKDVYRTAVTQNYSVNVQGGDDAGMYNLSVGYVTSESTAKRNGFDRMNVRFNTDINIIPILDTKFNLSINRTTNNLRDDGALEDFTSATPTSPTFLSLIKSPLLAPYQWNIYLNGGAGGFSSLLSNADDIFDALEVGNTSLANPLGILNEGDGIGKNRAENTNFRAMIEPTLKLGRYFRLTSLFSYQLNRNSQRYFRPNTVVPSFKIANLGTVYSKVATLFSKENNVLSNTHLDFNRIFGSHTVNAFVGFRYNIFSFDSDIIKTDYTDGTISNKTPHVSVNPNYYFAVGGDNDQWKQMQWYGNVDYNYQNRYFLTLSLLGEGNSRFGADADGALKLFDVAWALFPSVQAGWVLTNEKWFPRNLGVDYLRVNAGYDLSGNDGINNLAARTVYTVVKYNNVANGLKLTSIGNDKLKWETTSKLNLGFEANMLHNRLSVGFDYFLHKTSDMLTYKTFSDQISGINRYLTNGGEMQNEGFEARLSMKPIVTKSWGLEIGASVGHYKNEVTKLPDGAYTSSIYGTDNIITQVGSPVALFYGYKSEGVFSSEAAASTAHNGTDYLYMKDAAANDVAFHAGDVHFTDVDGDGYIGQLNTKAIDDPDRVVIGDPNPDIYGNIFANLNWKNLKLSLVFNYSLGNDVFNYQRMLLNSGSNFWNQQVATTNHWRYEGQETTMPRIAYGDPMQNNRFSDRWIEDGSYLRLKTLNLSYRLPVNSTWLQGLTVFGEATNLFTLTKYLGSDPETSVAYGAMYQGIDAGYIAQGRAFTLGLKINL